MSFSHRRHDIPLLLFPVTAPYTVVFSKPVRLLTWPCFATLQNYTASIMVDEVNLINIEELARRAMNDTNLLIWSMCCAIVPSQSIQIYGVPIDAVTLQKFHQVLIKYMFIWIYRVFRLRLFYGVINTLTAKDGDLRLSAPNA